MGQAIHHLVEVPDNDEIIYSEIMELVLKDVHGYPKPVGMNVNIFLQNSKVNDCSFNSLEMMSFKYHRE